ncbi:MAG: nickel-dependent lactate racemase [Gaiellaceae bacterium MAG52_C11]|nr:nickel-dependent lactate racemase [Candidatus Gaiellasilicea maunaloa]
MTRRIPILSGSRITVLNAPDDALVLRPDSQPQAVGDVGAAVREALRFPLSGPPLEALIEHAARATLVVELPELPLPGAPGDPRQTALEATIAELERLGLPSQRQTILVAGGLSRRAGQRELETLLAPTAARGFRGTVAVHDAEDPELVQIGNAGQTSLRVNRLLVETDLVITVTAAETVLHGGPGALVRSASTEVLRSAGAYSLLETAASSGWQIGRALESSIAEHTPVIGASLSLNPPRLTGRFHDYPYDEGALVQLAGSPLRRLSLLPSGLRRHVLQGLGRELTAAAAFAGPPSVAHVEALLRSIARRSVRVEEPLDAIVIGMPWKHHHQPRERLNPITAAAVALGLALRLWRDAFPVREGGTAIVLHRLTRHFASGTQDPYRSLFNVLRASRAPLELAVAERAAGIDTQALAAYRAGSACHPLLPYVDWESCRAALDRLGSVVVAGCRDHTAARTLGFVPTHGVGPALEMAHGVAGGAARIGLLLGPPYFPLEVGAAT